MWCVCNRGSTGGFCFHLPCLDFLHGHAVIWDLSRLHRRREFDLNHSGVDEKGHVPAKREDFIDGDSYRIKTRVVFGSV